MIKIFNKRVLASILATGIALSGNVSGICAKPAKNIEKNVETTTEENKSLYFLNDNTILHSGNNENSEKVCSISSGDSVEVMYECDNDWYYVKKGDNYGYIKGIFLTSEKPQNIVEWEEPIENVNEYGLDVIPAVEATVELNVRSKGSTEGKIVGVLQPGERVPIVKVLDNGWCQIDFHGKKAYVNGKYTKDASIIKADCIKLVYLKHEENSFYDKPDGSLIDTLPVLEFAKVYKEEGDYYLVEVEGNVGYVSKDDCKKLDDTCVVVDISDQTLTFYDELEEELTTSVVTGKDSTPSDTGLFDIYGKTTNRTLRGDNYESFVNYWMPYNGGEGLHDATWRSSFGGEGYHDDGSHGCINMPLSKAEELYSKVEVGDMVLVKK